MFVRWKHLSLSSDGNFFQAFLIVLVRHAQHMAHGPNVAREAQIFFI
jgi:hypothetical protein